MGPLLQPYTQQLVGVDLSQGMVNKAQERGCYDALAVDELVHFLQAAVEQQGE
jgi:predicted TPR repeat methyltransferase